MESPAGIASRLRRTMHGPMWHGPSVLDAVGDLTAEQAASYPLHGAHSVWELVLHIGAWAEIARARLDGTPWLAPTEMEDWPPVRDSEQHLWSRDTKRTVTAYEALAVAVKGLPGDALDALVAGQEYTRATMLHGVVEHGVYHAGQIVLLRRIITG